MTARTLAIAAAAAALLTLHAWYFDHVADDAYISLRYLESWLRGEGLVFNPGERVLGFSNALWVLALAPFGLAGLDLPSAAQGLGLALAVACVVGVCLESARRQATWLAPLAAGGWLGETLGWRTAFIIFGAPGLLLALMIRTLVREPERGAFDAERREGEEGQGPSAQLFPAIPVGRATRWIVTTPSMRNFVLASGLNTGGIYTILIWAVPYLDRVHDLSPSAAGAPRSCASGPSTRPSARRKLRRRSTATCARMSTSPSAPA